MIVATLQFQSALRIFTRHVILLLLMFQPMFATGCAKPRQQAADADAERVEQPPGLIDARIEGASMAPALKGAHQQAVCPECQAGFSYEAASSKSLSEIVCPLCGQQFPKHPHSELKPPSTVKIQPLHQKSRVERWDVIAFSDQNGMGHSVKRVVGLPFEKLTIQNGDLLVRGLIVAKSPQAQLDTRILLFDSQRVIDGQLKFSNGSHPAFPIPLRKQAFRFDYIHRANYDSPHRRQIELVKDFYGFNQATSRSLNLCHDLSCELQFAEIDTDTGPFEFQVVIRTHRYGIVKFDVVWTKEKITRTVHQDGARLLGTIGRRDKQGNELKVVLGIIDGQVRFVHDPKVNNSSPLVVRKNPDWNGEGPQISFSSPANCPAKLVRFRVFRDIYYYEKTPSEYQLGKDEYFVLGDNVPVSRDSRHGIRPTTRQLIGIIQ